MRLFLAALLSIAMLGGALLVSAEEVTAPTIVVPPAPDPRIALEVSVKKYLQDKKSPLADEVSVLLDQKHWKLLLGISRIESQFCQRKVSFNCWGVGGSSYYRHYNSYAEAIVDANALIEKWQAKGKWKTPESMLGSYVVPGSQQWVNTVNAVINDMEELDHVGLP